MEKQSREVVDTLSKRSSGRINCWYRLWLLRMRTRTWSLDRQIHVRWCLWAWWWNVPSKRWFNYPSYSISGKIKETCTKSQVDFHVHVKFAWIHAISFSFFTHSLNKKFPSKQTAGGPNCLEMHSLLLMLSFSPKWVAAKSYNVSQYYFVLFS